MYIIGAGMAGLIAAVVNPQAIIFEASASLPLDHLAVLRFRGDSVSKATGIPFRQVQVHKGIWTGNRLVSACDITMANEYSRKVTGRITDRSIWNMAPSYRYIAPPNFHAMLEALCHSRIDYDSQLLYVDKSNLQLGGAAMREISRARTPVISTIPMPVLNLVTAADVSIKEEFQHKEIYVNRFKVPDCDAFQTIYFPRLNTEVYRATLTGDDLIIESTRELTPYSFEQVQDAFAIDIVGEHTANDHRQRYGKIAPINDSERRRFISELTLKHSIYSLGRYATWRNILLDDVLEDIYVIRRLLEADVYTHLQKR